MDIPDIPIPDNLNGVAGVCLDEWKRPIFDRILNEHDFSFQADPFLKDGSVWLYRVNYDPTEKGFRELAKVIKLCEASAQATKRRKLRERLKCANNPKHN